MLLLKKKNLMAKSGMLHTAMSFGLNACHGIGEDKVSALNSFIEEKDAFIEMFV